MCRTAAVLLIAAAVLAGCGGVSGPDPDQLASDVGAISCTAESYYIESRLDGSKARLYSCDMGNKEICVTEENGLAQNVTEEAKLLFASTLSGGKPFCVTG